MSAVELNEALDVRGLTAGVGHARLSTLAEPTRLLAIYDKDRKPFKNDIGRSSLKNSNLNGLTDVANRT